MNGKLNISFTGFAYLSRILFKKFNLIDSEQNQYITKTKQKLEQAFYVNKDKHLSKTTFKSTKHQ